MTRAGRGTLPAELRAAGLIVPEPSIKLLPIPFNGVETGCGAEYMMVRGDDDGKMRVGWVEEGGWWLWLWLWLMMRLIQVKLLGGRGH